MRAVFLTSGTSDPATRFRARQFFEYFEAAGIRCDHHGAYGERYNDLFNSPLIGAGYKLGCRLKRAALTIGSSGYDLVFLQRTALNGSAFSEWVLSRLNPRIIYDFDDAIFLADDGSPSHRRARAFHQAVALSAHVIAGNSYLAAEAGVPEKTTVIPTVIDTDRYCPGGPLSTPGRIVIGWMGTAGNFANFSVLQPAILRILDDFPEVVFRIVSNGTYKDLAGHPRVEQVAWSASTELVELRGFDVGVMPLLDTPWTRGKCAFKVIQYMAVGRPAVASAVGANTEVIADGVSGLLARNDDDWYTALRALIQSEQLRRDVGSAARNRAVQRYAVASVVNTYIRLFEQIGRRQ